MFEQVVSILAKQFDADPQSITMDTHMVDDLGADSLDIVELLMALEDKYNINIPDDDAADLFTVGRIVEYMEKIQ